MKKPGFGIRFVVAALLLAISALIAFAAYNTYRHEATAQNRRGSGSETDKNVGQEQELRQALERSPLVVGHFRIIAEKNLFATTRTPWRPPVEETQQAEETAETAEPVARNDVKLHGTYVQNDHKFAILSLTYIHAARPRFILNEGETATDDTPNSKLSYTLEKVEEGKVIMRDQSGERFAVGIEKRTINAQATANPTSVVVTSDTRTQQPTKDEKKTSGGTSTKQLGDRTPVGKLSKDKRDLLLRQGVLKKVKTPMGSVYRYAD